MFRIGPRATMNLNELTIIDVESENLCRSLEDASVSTADGSATVYFKQIEERLLSHIAKADVVVGCVAWLTHHRVLRALGRKIAVSIIVQKEDFLRPDGEVNRHWKKQLR